MQHAGSGSVVTTAHCLLRSSSTTISSPGLYDRIDNEGIIVVYVVTRVVVTQRSLPLRRHSLAVSSSPTLQAYSTLASKHVWQRFLP